MLRNTHQLLESARLFDVAQPPSASRATPTQYSQPPTVDAQTPAADAVAPPVHTKALSVEAPQGDSSAAQ